ncbi:hypothetical protein [Polaribacter ponticola]|uniref:Uncharacterized protein n=1 Tax=Polaribacter ponticola TaxID=2978475 RepID=A0ABT5S9Q6_9FLAO|nr:hypothetical protein [Polaribacter sp. MSW5]MDD7914841.1 hypothetical protein [Polaribacter sp. MSW5]
MIITRDEYNNALDVIEAYQKQLFQNHSKESTPNNGKTKISDWIEFTRCGVRLKKALEKLEVYNAKEKCYTKIEYIEDVTKTIFLKQKSTGWKSWNEFVHLRGF